MQPVAEVASGETGSPVGRQEAPAAAHHRAGGIAVERSRVAGPVRAQPVLVEGDAPSGGRSRRKRGR